MIDKKRSDDLIELADKVLRAQYNDALKEPKGFSILISDKAIKDSYNGQIAALSVSIAMLGLKPTLAIYYEDKEESQKVNKRTILDVIGRMITEDKDKAIKMSAHKEYAKNLFRYVLDHPSDGLDIQIIECAIALKQVVRTYNLE